MMKKHQRKKGIASFIVFTTSSLLAMEVAATTIDLPSAGSALRFDQVLTILGKNYVSGSYNPVITYPGFHTVTADKMNPGDVISFKDYDTNSDGSTSAASASGVIKNDVPSINLTATTADAAVRVDANLFYYFQLNSDENKSYDVVVNAFGESKSGASVSKDGGYDYRFYGQINIDGLYTASVCSGDSSVRSGEICSNLFGEPVGTHNTFGEGVITLQSNQLYRVEMYASMLLQTWGGSGAGSVYVDPVFSLLDPTIQNVTFQFSDGIQNMAAPSPVPVPAAAWLFATGVPIVAAATRRKKQSV